MERVELTGGIIKAYRYHELSLDLEIEFCDGRRAIHSGVERSTYEAFTRSPGAQWAMSIMRRGHKEQLGPHATRWIGA